MDDRKRRKSCTVRDAKFVIDVTEVNLHGTLGEIKLAGYLLVRVSLAQLRRRLAARVGSMSARVACSALDRGDAAFSRG